MPIWQVTERFVDNVNFACMESWSDDYDFCLTESQTWVGADVQRVDCTAFPSDPSCDNTNIRMANLYEDAILCNDCFINQLYARVTSQFLLDSGELRITPYVTFLDIQLTCPQTTRTTLLIRSWISRMSATSRCRISPCGCRSSTLPHL